MKYYSKSSEAKTLEQLDKLEQTVKEVIDETEEIKKTIKKISELESEAKELREKYKSELTIKGFEKLTEKKLQDLWGKDIDTLKNLIIAYFKFIRQYPAPTLLDSQQKFNSFYNIILFLNKYELVMPLDPKTPQSLPYYMTRFKNELTFFAQLYNSYISPVPVGYGLNKYKLWIPSWKHAKSNVDILDYFNNLEFYEIMIHTINVLNELVEQILVDLSDMVDIGELIITSQQKKEKYEADLTGD